MMDAMPTPHVDDAIAFIVEFAEHPRNDGYSTYGYELYMPQVIAAYIKEVEHSTDHPTHIHNSPRVVELSPIFYEAGWELCRRGILRPGLKRMGLQATEDGASGNGYSLTSRGREWLSRRADALLVIEPSRLSQLFGKLSERLGAGFIQRANEAVLCHGFAAYLACCAMCGAAAESIILAVAATKLGEDAALKLYRGRDGRRLTIEKIAEGVAPAIANPFRAATGLLAYWRDDAAHGIASTISEIEAHEALARLIRFAQFTTDHWPELAQQAS